MRWHLRLIIPLLDSNRWQSRRYPRAMGHLDRQHNRMRWLSQTMIQLLESESRQISWSLTAVIESSDPQRFRPPNTPVTVELNVVWHRCRVCGRRLARRMGLPGSEVVRGQRGTVVVKMRPFSSISMGTRGPVVETNSITHPPPLQNWEPYQSLIRFLHRQTRWSVMCGRSRRQTRDGCGTPLAVVVKWANDMFVAPAALRSTRTSLLPPTAVGSIAG